MPLKFWQIDAAIKAVEQGTFAYENLPEAARVAYQNGSLTPDSLLNYALPEDAEPTGLKGGLDFIQRPRGKA